jgi:hypothetical protein
VAVEAGARVLPVALHGTAACAGRDGIHRATARAEILPALTVDEGGVAGLRDRAHAAIAGALAAAA